MNTPEFNLFIFAILCAVTYTIFSRRFGLLNAFWSTRKNARKVRMEDALKHAFAHDEQNTSATLASLTDALRISSTQSFALVERMQQSRLIRVVDGRILLTDEGRRHALQIVRAHRLWERYLADETGVDPVEWHALAERREHALSPDEANALSERLGNPRFDPHGDPIPTDTGEIQKDEVVPLTRLNAGDNARVAHVEDEPEAVYAQLVALGIYPGMELRIKTKSDERIIMEAEGRNLILAPLVASNVSVKWLSPREVEAEDRAHETLNVLRGEETAVVARLSSACRGLERRRLMDLGILPGTRVEYDRRGLTGGLTSYRVRGTVIALREEQAEMIAIQDRKKVAS